MKSIVSVIVLLFCYEFSVGQTYLVKQWDHTYGGFENETMTAIKETADRGFLIAGYTRSDSGVNVSEYTRGGTDFWVINTDSNGVLRWDKRFGGDFEDRIFSIDIASRGSVILGGYTTTDSVGDVSQHTRGGMDYWIVKTDSLGGKLWDRRFGGTDYDRFTSLVRCSDGGILAGGFTFSDSGADVSEVTRGGEDFWVVKMDSAGNKLWDKRFGGNNTDDLWSIIQTSDGGFLLGGMTNSDSTGDVSQPSQGFSDSWIVKINSLGVKLWDKRFGGLFGESVTSMTETSDGGYLIYNNTTSDSSGDVSQHLRDTSLLFMDRGDIWIFKIDSLGNKLWDRVIGGNLSDGGSGDVSRTLDNGYFFGANSFSTASGEKSEDNFGRSQSWIFKADSSGNKIWDKTIYSNSEDESSFQLQCSGGCYLVANNSHSTIGGMKTENSIGQNDFWMVKLCESEFPQLPVASYTLFDSLGLCVGGCFNFINNSLNAGIFDWSFPGGSPSSSFDPIPPAICYSTPGNHTFTLIASNNDGSDTISGTLTVFPLPIVTIQQSGDTLSVPLGNSYYQWYYEDTILLNDTNYYHIATQDGDYSILMLDSNGCPAFDTLFTFIVGVKSLAVSNSGIRIWPNPAKNYLNILSEKIIDEMAITDLAGRFVLNKFDLKESTIDVSHLSGGIYFIQFACDGKLITGKIIHQ